MSRSVPRRQLLE